MFTIIFHGKFNMSSCNASLAIAIKPKAKYILRAVAMLLFCILQKIAFRSCISLQDMLPYTTSASQIKCR